MLRLILAFMVVVFVALPLGEAGATQYFIKKKLKTNQETGQAPAAEPESQEPIADPPPVFTAPPPAPVEGYTPPVTDMSQSMALMRCSAAEEKAIAEFYAFLNSASGSYEGKDREKKIARVNKVFENERYMKQIQGLLQKCPLSIPQN